MKRRALAGILLVSMVFLMACDKTSVDTTTNTSSSIVTTQTSSDSLDNQTAENITDTQTTEDVEVTTSADNKAVHVNKINITINPEANIVTDDEGNVVEIEFLNEDAKTAYGDLDVEGKPLGEVAELLVEAAAEHEFLKDGKPITVTLIDSNVDGQAMLDELNAVKGATQKELEDQGFEKSPIYADVEFEHEHEGSRTCDLCGGSGLLVCDACNGTTYLDGLAWTTCGMCSGEGRTLCTLCEGAGSMACGNCGGTGLDAAEADGVCFSCKGTGITHCVRCVDSSGYQECYDCKGAGRLGGLPCPRCGGDLWTVCNRCNGSGELDN